MMEPKRQRAPRPNWRYNGGRITERDKSRILDDYEKRLANGERSEDTVETLDKKWRRSGRQIQRYIRYAREVREQKEKEEPRSIAREIVKTSRTIQGPSEQIQPLILKAKEEHLNDETW